MRCLRCPGCTRVVLVVEDDTVIDGNVVCGKCNYGSDPKQRWKIKVLDFSKG